LNKRNVSGNFCQKRFQIQTAHEPLETHPAAFCVLGKNCPKRIFVAHASACAQAESLLKGYLKLSCTSAFWTKNA
jgi:hypothetical protein